MWGRTRASRTGTPPVRFHRRPALPGSAGGAAGSLSAVGQFDEEGARGGALFLDLEADFDQHPEGHRHDQLFAGPKGLGSSIRSANGNRADEILPE